MMKRHKLMTMTPVLVAALSAGVQAADVSATLSTLEAYVGNPIVMRLEVTNAGQHDLPQVGSIDGVDVSAAGTPSRSSQTTIINGRRSERSSVTYAWKLIPRREGMFTIPPVSVEVDGRQQSTQALRFSATKSQTDDLLFAEIGGNQDEIYVGQPMKLKLHVWLQPFADQDLNITLSEADMWQMVAQDRSNWGMFEDRINELSMNNQRPAGEEVLRADGAGVERQYYLYAIEADIYPKRPGQIDGDSMQIVVDYPTRLGKTRDPLDSFFDRGFPSMFQDRMPSMFGSRLAVTDTRPIVTGAVVNATDVLAIPTTGRPADYRGAVGHYQIISQATPVNVKAGDPITLHLGIQGDGPMDLVQAPPLSQLPELRADFKVTEDPLAGIVQKDVKLFTTGIRPRREGITQIPAIPFSFFDPVAKEFKTVHSNPVAITVAAADQLALDAIVGRASNSQSPASSDAAAEPTLNLTNFSGKQVLESFESYPLWASILAWLLPPFVFLITLVTRNRQRLIELLGFSRGHDCKTALCELGIASLPGEISKTLVKFAAERLNMTSASLGSKSVIERAELTLTVDTMTKLRSIMQKCEQWSYAGVDASDISGLRDEAAICLQRLAAELPAAENRNGRRQGIAFSSRKTAKAAAIIAFAALALSGAPKTSAAQLSIAQSAQLLAEAESEYARANQNSKTDAAESKQAFSEAARKYQTLVDDGVVNDRLHFNLGNAYLQTGSMGRAIANYEQALALNSKSPARQNLVQARALLPHSSKQFDEPIGVFHSVHNWNEALPHLLVLGFGLLGWAILWLGASGYLLSRVQQLRSLMIPAAVLTTICVASLCLHTIGPHSPDRVVVVAPKVHLREGNGNAFTELNAVVYEGAGYDLLERRGDWMRVSTPESSGWIHQRDAVHVAARLFNETPEQTLPNA